MPVLADFVGRWIPFYRPITLPGVGWHDAPLVAISGNEEWMAIVVSAVKALTRPETWDGPEIQRMDGISQAENLLIVGPAVDDVCPDYGDIDATGDTNNTSSPFLLTSWTYHFGNNDHQGIQAHIYTSNEDDDYVFQIAWKEVGTGTVKACRMEHLCITSDNGQSASPFTITYTDVNEETTVISDSFSSWHKEKWNFSVITIVSDEPFTVSMLKAGGHL